MRPPFVMKCPCVKLKTILTNFFGDQLLQAIDRRDFLLLQIAPAFLQLRLAAMTLSFVKKCPCPQNRFFVQSVRPLAKLTEQAVIPWSMTSTCADSSRARTHWHPVPDFGSVSL